MLFLSKFDLKPKAIVPGDFGSVMARTNAGDFIGYSAAELLFFALEICHEEDQLIDATDACGRLRDAGDGSPGHAAGG
jgi:hypothetical protein